jgi:hypothetical protein
MSKSGRYRSDDLFRPALERLVAALSGPEKDNMTRLSMLEEAVHYSIASLGLERPETEELHSTFLDLATQIIVDKMEMDDVGIYRIMVSGSTEEQQNETAAVLVASTLPNVMQDLNFVVDSLHLVDKSANFH